MKLLILLPPSVSSVGPPSDPLLIYCYESSVLKNAAGDPESGLFSTLDKQRFIEVESTAFLGITLDYCYALPPCLDCISIVVK